MVKSLVKSLSVFVHQLIGTFSVVKFSLKRLSTEKGASCLRQVPSYRQSMDALSMDSHLAIRRMQKNDVGSLNGGRHDTIIYDTNISTPV